MICWDERMELRELKALEIAARCHLKCQDGTWIVPSQTSPGKTYLVNIWASPTCTCDDFQTTAKPCKHILAARIAFERDGGKSSAIVVDTEPKRKTYKQNWPLYNRAQQTEKNRFQELLAELCRGLVDPPQPGVGRRRMKLADVIFSIVFKVYTSVSSRRFACDLQEAFDRGHISHCMNSVQVCIFLEKEDITPILKELIVRSSLPLKAIETTFAPDSTGFSTSRFHRWFDEKYGCNRSGKVFVKAHAICGVQTNIITGIDILDQYSPDCPQFAGLVNKTAENFKIDRVCADKAYVDHGNLDLVEKHGGTAYIPFKANSVPGAAGSVWEKMHHYYQFRREEFNAHYHQRSNIESTFSMVKAKFGDHVRSRTDTAMKNEVLCKFLCHNIVVVHQSAIELGIEPVFWPENGTELYPSVLPFTRA